MTILWACVRLAAAALGTVALARQFSLTLAGALDAATPWASHVPTVMTNFFSYFTILSNLLAAVSLAIGGVWLLRHRRARVREPAWLAVLLVCAATYMIVTGIVYNVLLRKILVVGFTDTWTNETLHVIIPLVMLADVLFAPHRRALPYPALGYVVAFPLAWAAYTLLRADHVTGPATGNPWWYPYPFLDPHLQGGYAGVVPYIVGIAAVVVLLGAVIIQVGRWRAAPALSPRR